MKILQQKYLIITVIFVFISLISFFVIYQLLASKEHEKNLSEQQIIQEAKAHFQGMVDTRSWNAQYGGVYVKAKNGLKPNPYLKNNTLLTKDNQTLIKINPAWMTRQISEISNEKGSYHFKITSLKPINPSNMADIFEAKALQFFDKNKDKKHFYNFNKESKNFNFMGALATTQSCLKCHEHQGYKVGDIRGGIRVSIPLTLHEEQISLLEEKVKNSISIVVFIAITLMVIMYLLINMLFKRKYEIEHANEILEEKVQKRTKDLETVLSREQHLKGVLKIITEVNELLISSYSTKSILINATEKLATNEQYSLVASALIRNNLVEVISKSKECKEFIPQSIISLDADFNFLFDAIKKASKLKHPIIEKLSNQCIELKRREEDFTAEWFIVLPLVHGLENDIYGMITVFSSKKDGFELEEMKILENMAQDISIALYSHKQRDSILAMEKEKTANYEETILAFVNIIEQRDTYTAGHTIRVAEYCALIAKEMGYSTKEILQLEKAAILHDIGKVATPDTILLKPGKLSHLEYELIKQHSEVGADMLERITIYKDLANIIRYHHSRYDGTGYPKTTSPDEIPMLSHIMIVADAFDAMTTNRIYRPRKNITEALEELEASNRTQFHPDVIKAALATLKNVNLSNTTQLPSSELEKRRMAYFFQDGLTGLYNEDYLQSVLNTSIKKYTCLNILDLKKFTQYNKKFGWEEGNTLLKKFAEFLKTTFPESLIIRFHGDDFVVLHKVHKIIQTQEIGQFDAIKDNTIHVKISHLEIDENFSFEDFKKMKN